MDTFIVKRACCTAEKIEILANTPLNSSAAITTVRMRSIFSSKQDRLSIFSATGNMCDLSDISIEKVRLWSTEALKSFLCVRKKSVEGAHEELVARAFAALEDGVPVDHEAENTERVLLEEYKQKLTVKGVLYPDPFAITSGWKGEQDGRVLWPSVCITDISDYLKQTAACELDLVHRLINEYKEGKAYRYYTCERVREIKYHPVRTTSANCYLCASVYPSMSTRKPYKVWVMVSKKGETTVGGEIQAAYCTCPAGLLGSCNHVAGLLFRVEAAVKDGVTQKSATEVSCQWIIPKGPVGRKPQAVCETLLSKDKYGKKTSHEEKRANKQVRDRYTAFSPHQAAELQDAESMRNRLQAILEEEVPDCVFVRTRKRLPPVSKSQPSPPPIPQILPPVLTHSAAGCTSVKELVGKMAITEKERDFVESNTRGQATSPTWHSQRLGRITASKFYNVYTKSLTLLNQETVSDDMGDPLANSFITNKYLNTPAVQHGRTLEPAAKEAAKIELMKSHTNCTFKDCGLFLSVNHPYLGASPDLLVSCSCCGHFVVEIKCPVSLADCVPTADNIPYVQLNQGNMMLKERHVYFGQIQGQIALTGADFAMLFVYSVHGHVFVKVNKDSDFWTDMCEKLTWFWTRFVGPKLLEAVNPSVTSVCSSDLPSTSSAPLSPTIMPSVPAGPSLLQLPVVRYTPRRVLKRKRATPTLKPMYLCGSCGDDIPENPQDFKDFSIQCDHCPQWYHFSCVGIKEGEVPDDTDIWKCPKCISSL